MTKSKADQLRLQYDGKLDPSVPKDGKCVVCGGARPGSAITHKDPFCSTNCARMWFEAHGVGG